MDQLFWHSFKLQEYLWSGDDGGWGWDAEQRLERWVIRTFDTASRDYETVEIIYIRYSSIGILILGRSHVK